MKWYLGWDPVDEMECGNVEMDQGAVQIEGIAHTKVFKLQET